MINRKINSTAKIAVFAVAHGTYFPQFPALKDKLLAHHANLLKMLTDNGVEVCDFGIIESSEKAFETAELINGASADLIVCNMITYATSSVFAPIMRNCAAPMILVALQPLAALDYTHASTEMQLENDNICSVPEFIGVAERFNKRIHDVIIGTLYSDNEAKAEIEKWCSIAKVLSALHGARLGMMGHTMEAMYDMHTDPTMLSAAFGIHTPLLEIDELMSLYNEVTETEILDKCTFIDAEFEFPEPKSDPVTMKLTEDDKREAAKVAVALDRFIEKNNLTGLAYYYEGESGTPIRRLASNLIVGNSILNAEGIPMCGEYDVKTLVAMLIMDRLGIGGSFAELHPFDFSDNIILVGHDGPHHLRIADGKPKLRSLKKYHGKPGSGASVEFKIKEGPITMLGITQTAQGKFKFVIGEGVSEAGPIPPTGNTNTRARFLPDTKTFVKRWVMEGPTHHFALGVGHHADELKLIADILGIEAVIVK